MKCPNCGKKIDKDDRFCISCGAAINQETPKKKKSGKGKIVAVIALICVALIAGVGFATFKMGLWGSDDIIKLVSDDASAENITIYEDGDVVAGIDMEHVVVDEDTFITYIDNRLIVFTVGDLSDEDATALADIVDGEVIGDISGMINMLQIRVAVSSLDELDAMADTLMDEPEVAYASYDYPIATEIDGRSDKENSETGSWWIEAIGADVAWEFSDYCQVVTVGVIDNGFDLDHTDLVDENGNFIISILKEYPVNSEAKHGTHVAGIIAGRNNEENYGMRGIADTANIVAADWSPTEDEDLTLTGDYVEMIKQMVQCGACVINNSWGEMIFSEKGYAKDVFYESNEDYSAQGYYSNMDDESIILTPQKNEKGYFDDDIKYSFSANDIEHVDFYINNEIVTQAKFKKAVAKDVEKETDQKGTIYLVMEEGYVTEVHFLEQSYDFSDEISRLDYEAYLEGAEIFAKKTGDFSLNMIVQILRYSAENDHMYDDFIIVQSAGNGYDNGLYGYDTSLSGYFCAIDEEEFEFSTAASPELYEGYDISYDDIADRIIVVGAVENSQENGAYKMTYFSNYGDNVDICAPGMDIYSTVTNNKYELDSGTSMAAPMVSASVALIWSLNPDLTAGEVKSLLISTAGRAVGVTDEDAGREYPMLNLGSAVIQTVRGSITGIIVDSKTGEAISDVSVTISTDASSGDDFNYSSSNSASDCSFAVSAVGSCTLTLEKDGYETKEITVDVDMRENIDLGEVSMISVIVEDEPDIDLDEDDDDDEPTSEAAPQTVQFTDEDARVAYLEFLYNEQYPDEVSEDTSAEYAMYDINDDGISELILHFYAAGCDKTYYIYGYDGEVFLIGDCYNSNREGTYYSADENAFVIISFGGADSLTYEFYDVSDELTLMFTIHHMFTGPGLGTETEDNPYGYETWSFSYMDSDGDSRDMTSFEWSSYTDGLIEIEFTDLADLNYSPEDVDDGSALATAVSNVVFETKYTTDDSNYYESADISAYDEGGNLVWSYKTGKYTAAQGSYCIDIGQRGDAYYFIENGSIIALDVTTGEVLWTNDDLGRGSGSAAFTENAICIAGNGLFAVSYDGEILCEIMDFGIDDTTTGILDVEGNTVILSFEFSAYIARVDTETWEYELEER